MMTRAAVRVAALVTLAGLTLLASMVAMGVSFGTMRPRAPVRQWQLPPLLVQVDPFDAALDSLGFRAVARGGSVRLWGDSAASYAVVSQAPATLIVSQSTHELLIVAESHAPLRVRLFGAPMAPGSPPEPRGWHLTLRREGGAFRLVASAIPLTPRG